MQDSLFRGSYVRLVPTQRSEDAQGLDGAAMAAAVTAGAAVAAAAEGSSGRRYHVRTGSAGSWDGMAASAYTADEEIVVNFLQVEMRNFS